MLTGMIPPSSGTAVLNGFDIKENLEGVQNSLGICPQHNVLFESLTVGEHIQFFGRLKGVPDTEIDKEVERYSDLLQLEPDIQAKKLSGGMKRKLAIGVALCGDSKIILCDEPSSVSNFHPFFLNKTLIFIFLHRESIQLPVECYGICLPRRKWDVQFSFPAISWTKQIS